MFAGVIDLELVQQTISGGGGAAGGGLGSLDFLRNNQQVWLDFNAMHFNAKLIGIHNSCQSFMALDLEIG